MKGFVQNLAVKIISFILFVVLVLSVFVCALLGILMIKNDVYYDGGKSLYDEIYSEYAYNKLYMIEDYLNDSLNKYDAYALAGHLSPEATNLRYTAVDGDGKVYGTNMSEGDELYEKYRTKITCFILDSEEVFRESKAIDGSFTINDYLIEFEGENKRIIEHGVYTTENGEARLEIKYRKGAAKDIFIEFGSLTQPIKRDILFYYLQFADFGLSLKDGIFIYSLCAIAALIFLFVVLMCGAGHKKGVEGIYLCKFHRIPFDLYIALNLLTAYVAIEFVSEFMYSDLSTIVGISGLVILFTTMMLGLFVTFAARVKTDGWYKNTVIYYCISKLIKGIRLFFKALLYVVSKISLFYKVLLSLIILVVLEFLFLAFGLREYIVFWVIEKIILTPLILYFVFCMRALQRTARKIASGEIGYRADTKYMIFDFKEHGETLNGIGNGLASALEKSVKSERLKAELITNVSHDIKTPLTSIINYVDLLKKEDGYNEKTKEYIEVLDRQSGRLKKLTEDLIEASKASTGNISVNLEKTDVNVLLTQVVGEYEERLTKKRLTIVTEFSEGELNAMADGRCLWRVFDNLMGNICKYSQTGTRVYITSRNIDGCPEVVFKNISGAPLNIAPEELTERFVRGDKSRYTEGSGLGLSIAKSLTELQGGNLEIFIDGDLFKVSVTLKKADI